MNGKQIEVGKSS